MITRKKTKELFESTGGRKFIAEVLDLAPDAFFYDCMGTVRALSLEQLGWYANYMNQPHAVEVDTVEELEVVIAVEVDTVEELEVVIAKTVMEKRAYDHTKLPPLDEGTALTLDHLRISGEAAERVKEFLAKNRHKCRCGAEITLPLLVCGDCRAATAKSLILQDLDRRIAAVEVRPDVGPWSADDVDYVVGGA